MIDLVYLRSVVKRFRSTLQFESAVFWAEKLVAYGRQQLEEADPNAKNELVSTFESDLLALGELFMLKGEFLRASRILGKYTIPNDSPNGTLIRYQIARCLFEARQFCEALELLNSVLAGWNDSVSSGTRKNLKTEFEKVLGSPKPSSGLRPTRVDGAKRGASVGVTCVRKRQSSIRAPECVEMRAACLLLLAKVHMELESRSEACELLRTVLQLDPFCVEAWHILQRGALLSDAENTDLLRSISRPLVSAAQLKTAPNDISCVSASTTARELVGDLCELRLHASTFASSVASSKDAPGDFVTAARRFDACLSRVTALKGSVDVQLSLAERALALSNYAEALAITTRLLDQADSLHTDALVVHTAALVGLRKANELFRLAHTLMDDSDAGGASCNSTCVPLQAVSWYVSAAYYYVVGNREACRKQAGRALQLAPAFVPGWLLVGHTLADEFEYDQAISAYSHANKLCRNAPYTLVCVALAYSRVRNARVAGEFLRAAHRLRTADPHTLNELGVLAYSERDYSGAVHFLHRAFRILTGADSQNDPEPVQVQFTSRHTALSSEWNSLINNLGHALRRAGRLEEAVAAHRYSLRLNVHHAPTWNALALALACSCRFEEAAAAVERALRLCANDIFAYDLFEKLLARLAESGVKHDALPMAAANRYEPVGFDKILDSSEDLSGAKMQTEHADEATVRAKEESGSVEACFFRKLKERERAAANTAVFKVPRAAAWRASVTGGMLSTPNPNTLASQNESASADSAQLANASNPDVSAAASASVDQSSSIVDTEQSSTSRDDDGDIVMDDS